MEGTRMTRFLMTMLFGIVLALSVLEMPVSAQSDEERVFFIWFDKSLVKVDQVSSFAEQFEAAASKLKIQAKLVSVFDGLRGLAVTVTPSDDNAKSKIKEIVEALSLPANSVTISSSGNMVHALDT